MTGRDQAPARVPPDDPACTASGAPVVSIIVVSFNGRHWLERCLPATVAETGADCELIVVDNGSTDGSVALLDASFPQARVVALSENLGFAGGNNAGARVARGRYLAFINNDASPQQGWLAALRAVLDGHADVGLAASCIVFLDDPTVVDSAGDGITRYGGAFKHGHGGPVSEQQRAREVFGACGAAFLIRRDLYERLGGFDPHYFAVHEDVDLSYRSQLLGYHCVYTPKAVVHHGGSSTLGRLSARAVYWGQRNVEWTYLKNTPWPLLLLTLPGHLIGVAAAAAYFARAGHFWTFCRAKAAAVCGLARVWRQRRAIQAARRVPWRRIRVLMHRGWIAMKVQEKRFILRQAPVE